MTKCLCFNVTYQVAESELQKNVPWSGLVFFFCNDATEKDPPQGSSNQAVIVLAGQRVQELSAKVDGSVEQCKEAEEDFM